MAVKSLGVVMNGVTGRMGYRQHLVRSIIAINEQGGVELSDGSRVTLDPVLVGRSEEKLRDIATRHGLERWTTDLDAALGDAANLIYFDAQLTSVREESIVKAIEADKHIYTEKPVSETVDGALTLAKLAKAAGVKNGVVHDKLFLPGLLKLRRLVESGFFGRILSVRGEFGYWVFEGDWQEAQRPSWNYRSEDGGGIVVDMFCHWDYVLTNLFGRVEAVTARAVTHIPERWDERGERYDVTADDAAYAIFELAGGVVAQFNSSWAVRVHRDELLELQVDGTLGSAVAGLHQCVIQPRTATPRPTWNPDLADVQRYREQWQDVPDNSPPQNGFKAQWEQFVRHVIEDAPHPYDFLAGARGVRLAQAGLQSSADGCRVELPELTL
ncbi:Gfo/Idh/MocA family oxidoreductase [Jiangella ureilytica]|uniref:Gfo/Idh/MocA family oxidoreductase n=1 Tax=Jiangella ureilytica TaxID=2530374 RepID=A0A4V2XVP2_9ACTN|nr:Gfo/Idh/MocA family oxidoreductase [Jiangella ureilytica]TDC46175.1 Gfo/Idh/MocA family oxidoreductase [Jiangella ureilytica]